MKKILTTFVTTVLFFGLVTSVSAQYGSYQPPTTSLSILVDKKVGNPVVSNGTITISYVDNLGQSDHRFVTNEDVWFQVKVKNTANTKISGVTLKDTIPSYITPIEGPGTYDSSNRVLTVNAGDFAVNEEKVFAFKMRVIAADLLVEGTNCVSNKAQAYNNDVSDDDSAQICIEKPITTTTTTKGGVPVTKTIPATGPEEWLLLYTILATGTFTGLKLRRSK